MKASSLFALIFGAVLIALIASSQLTFIAAVVVLAAAYVWAVLAIPNDEELARLRKFKAYVHGRLDEMRIPVDPESIHQAVGCRVGGRLDVVEHMVHQALADGLVCHKCQGPVEVEGDSTLCPACRIRVPLPEARRAQLESAGQELQS